MATPGEEFGGDKSNDGGNLKAVESCRHPENQRTLGGSSIQTSADVN